MMPSDIFHHLTDTARSSSLPPCLDYFLPSGGFGWLWLSCLDFAAATPSALAASFCFWPRCFDLGDLSPMDASVRWRKPSVRRLQSPRQRTTEVDPVRAVVGSAEHDAHPVRRAVVSERDRRAARKRRAVELDARYPTRHTAGVLDRDLVVGRVVAEAELDAARGAADARVEVKRAAPDAEAQDPLDAGAMHPAGGARVPGPAATAHVRWFGVDIGRRHIGLHLVAVDAGARAGVVDGVQDREQLARLVAVAERREREHGPEGRVRVLAAVLAHAREVATHVARITRRVIERRREEQNQAVAAAHQVFLDRRHGAGRAAAVGGARDHPPRLRDRVDAALLVGDRAERRAVVEVGAPVPVAVPGLPLERRLEGGHVPAPGVGALVLAAQLGKASELPEGGVQEPAEPDALAHARLPDAVHAVVPVAGAHEGKPVAPDEQAAVERPSAVLEEGGPLARQAGLEVRLPLAGGEGGPLEEGDDL